MSMYIFVNGSTSMTLKANNIVKYESNAVFSFSLSVGFKSFSWKKYLCSIPFTERLSDQFKTTSKLCSSKK